MELLPDYLGDLNAMARAEATLTAKKRRWYCNHMRAALDNEMAISAGTKIRAKCFLMANEKWDDSAPTAHSAPPPPSAGAGRQS